MAFMINALMELKPNGKYAAFEEDDGTLRLEWDKDENNGEEAPTQEELTKKAAEIRKFFLKLLLSLKSERS